MLETLGLDPEGDEDEPDEPSGPYELPHRIAEFSPPKRVAGRAVTGQADQRPGSVTEPELGPKTSTSVSATASIS